MGLAREVLRLAIMGGAVVSAAVLRLPPIAGVAAVSVAGSLNYLLYGAISWRAIGTHAVRHQLVTAAPIAVARDGDRLDPLL